jgi:hypothetical protein
MRIIQKTPSRVHSPNTSSQMRDCFYACRRIGLTCALQRSAVLVGAPQV